MASGFDFFSDEFQHDPGATFARMIDECPVHKLAPLYSLVQIDRCMANRSRPSTRPSMPVPSPPWKARMVFRKRVPGQGHTDGVVFSNGRDEFAAVRMEKMTLLTEYFRPHIAAKVAMDERGESPGNDLIGLLAYPEQYARLKAHPGLLDQAIEEVLRFESPAHGLFRTNNVEIELGGYTIPKDTKICLMWGSANRDPELYANPNTFDVSRDLRALRQNLTFGQRLHKCLGASLARLECRVFAQEMMRRIPEFEADGDAVPYPYATLNGLDRLPIRFPPQSNRVTKP